MARVVVVQAVERPIRGTMEEAASLPPGPVDGRNVWRSKDWEDWEDWKLAFHGLLMFNDVEILTRFVPLSAP